MSADMIARFVYQTLVVVCRRRALIFLPSVAGHVVSPEADVEQGQGTGPCDPMQIRFLVPGVWPT